MIPWRPISEAPRTGQYVLLRWSSSGHVSVGRWNMDQYAKKPRPFWDCEARSWMGAQFLRASPPDFWASLEPVSNDGSATVQDWRLAVGRLLASFERLDGELAAHPGLTDLFLEMCHLKRMLGERL